MTPVCDKTGSARLLDVVEGRSKKAFQQWLADRPKDWRNHVEGVAMEGFSGSSDLMGVWCDRVGSCR